MCIDKDKKCPINMIIMKNSSEPPTEYKYTFKSIIFNDGSYLYYTNEAIDHHIVAEIKISDAHRALILMIIILGIITMEIIIVNTMMKIIL